MGEFKVLRGEEEIERIMEEGVDLIEGRKYMKVETLSGFPCYIKVSDIKTCGLLSEFIRIADAEIAKKTGKTEAVPVSGFDSVRLGYSSRSGMVSVNTQNSKSGEVISIDFDLEDFVKKVVDELPNPVTDAIMEEKERRAYS